jgi:hypothetical protein
VYFVLGSPSDIWQWESLLFWCALSPSPADLESEVVLRPTDRGGGGTAQNRQKSALSTRVHKWPWMWSDGVCPPPGKSADSAALTSAYRDHASPQPLDTQKRPAFTRLSMKHDGIRFGLARQFSEESCGQSMHACTCGISICAEFKNDDLNSGRSSFKQSP